MEKMIPENYTVSEAAKALEVTPRTAYNLIHSGAIAAICPATPYGLSVPPGALVAYQRARVAALARELREAERVLAGLSS